MLVSDDDAAGTGSGAGLQLRGRARHTYSGMTYHPRAVFSGGGGVREVSQNGPSLPTYLGKYLACLGTFGSASRLVRLGSHAEHKCHNNTQQGLAGSNAAVPRDVPSEDIASQCSFE